LFECGKPCWLRSRSREGFAGKRREERVVGVELIAAQGDDDDGEEGDWGLPSPLKPEKGELRRERLI